MILLDPVEPWLLFKKKKNIVQPSTRQVGCSKPLKIDILIIIIITGYRNMESVAEIVIRASCYSRGQETQDDREDHLSEDEGTKRDLAAEQPAEAEQGIDTEVPGRNPQTREETGEAGDVTRDTQ